MISTPVYVAEVARSVGHIRAVVTDDGGLDEPRLGQAGYVDRGADGQFIADRPDSPALTKLRDYFDGWDQAGRPGLEALEPVLRRVGGGWSVRTALPWPDQQRVDP